ncbi:MAG: putative pyridoxal-dependent aspartate 1-decarboxylase, partial [Deltaproteobacteria bacterium]|nr:putative pyridoxal-dependent aspartate 1-decarboxylase [Deltaproteobacteria bacterium]
MMEKTIHKNKKELIADWQTLMRTFIRSEDDATRVVLLKYMEQILFGLDNFLKKHVGVTQEIPLEELACRFNDTIIRKNPEKKLEQVIA